VRAPTARWRRARVRSRTLTRMMRVAAVGATILPGAFVGPTSLSAVIQPTSASPARSVRRPTPARGVRRPTPAVSPAAPSGIAALVRRLRAAEGGSCVLPDLSIGPVSLVRPTAPSATRGIRSAPSALRATSSAVVSALVCAPAVPSPQVVFLLAHLAGRNRFLIAGMPLLLVAGLFGERDDDAADVSNMLHRVQSLLQWLINVHEFRRGKCGDLHGTQRGVPLSICVASTAARFAPDAVPPPSASAPLRRTRPWKWLGPLRARSQRARRIPESTEGHR